MSLTHHLKTDLLYAVFSPVILPICGLIYIGLGICAFADAVKMEVKKSKNNSIRGAFDEIFREDCSLAGLIGILETPYKIKENRLFGSGAYTNYYALEKLEKNER